MNGKEELVEKLRSHRYVHFIIRTVPDKTKPSVNVGFLNNLNCFYKPGYEFKSMSLENDKIEEFLSLIENGFIEAFCVID